MEETTNSGSGGGNDALADPKEAGTSLLKQGQFAEAATVLREAVAADPSDEAAWGLLGAALASKGDNDGAIEAFSRATALLPTLARNHYNLGLAYESAGRLAEARASLDRAINLDPGHEQARTRLGAVMQRLDPRATPAADGHTNISGGGNATGLASIGGIQAPPAPAEGHTNISGGANTTGLSDVGMASAPAAAVPEGHTNIGGSGSMTSSLSGVGAGGSATSAQGEGHTNIGGADSRGLGTVGTPAMRPADAPPRPPASAAPAYGTGTAYAPPPVLGMQYDAAEVNNSGMKSEPVPAEINRWNWAAFGFSFFDLGYVWSFNMRLPAIATVQLLAWLVPVCLLIASGPSMRYQAAFQILRVIGGLIRIGLAVYLGIAGSRLAWMNRRFESAEDFRACQRIWGWWCLGFVILSFVIAILLIALFGMAAAALFSGSRRTF